MASLSSLSLLLLLLPILSLSSAVTSRPKSLVLPITKDADTLQYLIYFRQLTFPIRFTLDLGGRYLSTVCVAGFDGLSFQGYINCGSRQCSLAKSHNCPGCYPPTERPGCHTQGCYVDADNSITNRTYSGDLVYGTFSFVSTDGSTPGAAVAAPQFLFACTTGFGMLAGLASGTAGMAGLGRSATALPTQFAVAFRIRRQFAICLPSSTSSDVNGVAFFGPGPYKLLSNTDASQSLTYTPLIINPVNAEGFYIKGDKSDEYFIKVSSIKVNNKPIKLNKTLLLINKKGYGGTKISTVTPYTTLETSIYTALTRAFVTALAKVKRVKAVSPFKVCYNAKDLGSTRVGAAVPAIDLVLHRKSVYWTIFGANSMVSVSDKVLCLGFLDGGKNPRTSIVIGGHQFEDNLLQFDLGKSVLGFSSSLLFRQTTCANFNFTSTS